MSAVAACGACLRRGGLVGLLAPRIAAALDRPGRPSAGVLALDDEDLIAAVGGRRPEPARRFLAEFDESAAREGLERAGFGAVCPHAGAYPRALLRLEDPPAAVYHAGAPEALERALDGPSVAVVGARRSSAYGVEVAYGLGRGLAAAGVGVVSGLALGVDAAAHQGALDGRGRPIAVLAAGVDVAYPRTNRPLHERVRGTGILLSEVPPGVPVFRWSFPARNRIMAALGRMTVVVEAAESSGSLITAAFAAQLGRDVGAVPGRVTARGAAGGNRLLREGASVIRGAEDVLDELFGAGKRPGPAGPAPPGEPPPARVAPDTSADSLEPALRRVLDAVEGGESLAGIGRAAGLAAGEARAALGRLELLGLIGRDGLGTYERRAGR